MQLYFVFTLILFMISEKEGHTAILRLTKKISQKST